MVSRKNRLRVVLDTITNDGDLLDIPRHAKLLLPFAIVTPQQFLREFES